MKTQTHLTTQFALIATTMVVMIVHLEGLTLTMMVQMMMEMESVTLTSFQEERCTLLEHPMIVKEIILLVIGKME